MLPAELNEGEDTAWPAGRKGWWSFLEGFLLSLGWSEERIHLSWGWPEGSQPLCIYRRYVGCGSVSLVLFFNLSKKQALSHPRALLTVEILRFLVNPNLEADIREFCWPKKKAVISNNLCEDTTSFPRPLPPSCDRRAREALSVTGRPSSLNQLPDRQKWLGNGKGEWASVGNVPRTICPEVSTQDPPLKCQGIHLATQYGAVLADLHSHVLSRGLWCDHDTLFISFRIFSSYDLRKIMKSTPCPKKGSAKPTSLVIEICLFCS